MDCEGYRKSWRLVNDGILMAITMTMALVAGFFSVWLLLLCGSFMLPLSVRILSGPRRLPPVGNLLLMRNFESFQDLVTELKRKYGPILTLCVGSNPVVIMLGPNILGHTHLPPVRILNFGNRGPTSGHGEILSKTRAAGFKTVRDREVHKLIQSLKKKQVRGDSKGGNIIVEDFRSLIRPNVCNMTVGVLFGGRLIVEAYMEVDEVTVQRFQMGVGEPWDFTPQQLAWLPDRKADKLQLALGEQSSQIFEPLIEEKKKQTVKSGKMEQATFVDTLFGLQSEEIFVIPIEVNDLQFCKFLIL